MANFVAFRWNFSSSTNPEFGRSDYVLYTVRFRVQSFTSLMADLLQDRDRVWRAVCLYVLISAVMFTHISAVCLHLFFRCLFTFLLFHRDRVFFI